MSRIRNIYQVENVFTGPSPGSGMHFLNVSGVFNNQVSDLNGQNFNLIKPLARIQSVSYEISRENFDILQLGQRGIKHRLPINSPTINLNFDYIQFGVINELRCGLYANYSQNYVPFSGEPYFSGFSQSLIKGFVTRSLQRSNNDLMYPYDYRDKRNIFVAIGREGNDLNRQTGVYQEIDVNASGYSVYGFGNCYLSSYKCQASVSDFPKASISYVCENMVFYLSGSGAEIPALQPINALPYSGIKFAIPSSFQGTGSLSTLRPGDITFSITSLPQITGDTAVYRGGTGISRSAYSDVFNLGVDVSDYKIQNYSIDLTLPREPLNSLGYRLPIDRKVKFPVFANLNLSAVIGEGQSGSFIDNLNKNDDYNITIKLRNPSNKGIPPGQVAIQYDLLRAKLGSLSFESNIGSNKTVNLSFITELDVDDLTKGLFVSGLLNVDTSSIFPSYLLKEDGGFLLKEDGGRILLNTQYLLY